jgi:hypothetical protein
MTRTPPAATIAAMPSNPPLHVLPHRLGTWFVQREGDHEPLSEHGNETEAELAATREAGTGEVIVHDRYQRVHDVRGR